MTPPLAQWLAELERALGLGSLPLAATGACAVELASGLRLGLEPSRDGSALLLHAELGPLPRDEAELLSLCADLLARNDLAAGDGPGSFAVDPRRDSMFLWASTALEKVEDAAGLLALLQAFAARAEAARAELEGAAAAPADPASLLADARLDPLFLHGQFIRA